MSKTATDQEPAKTFITIEIKDMISHGGELGTAMVNFLSEKLAKDVTVTLSDTEVYVRSDFPNHPSKTQLRTYLKRFLHLNALRADLKLISQGKDRFAVIEYVTIEYVEE